MGLWTRIKKAAHEGSMQGAKDAANTKKFFREVTSQKIEYKERSNKVLLALQKKHEQAKPRLKSIRNYGSNLRNNKYF